MIAGVFILVGLWTRLAALTLIAVMIVALITAKAEEITGLSTLVGLSEYLYIVLLTWLAVFGANWISIDRLIGYLKQRTTSKN